MLLPPMIRRSYKGIGNPAFSHGLHKSPTWYSWTFMKQRCLNPNRSDYKYYGGRGIRICEAWHWFPYFLADMGIRPEGKTLDRINNEGDYEPSNCKWSTRTEQSNNCRIRVNLPNRNIKSGKFIKTLKEDCKLYV